MENKDPRFINAYNHINLNEDGKPLISNEDYNLLLGQVKSGNKSAYKEAQKKYSFERKQKKLIEDIINNRII